jgi:chitinase
VGDVSVGEGDGGVKSLTFTLTLTQAANRPVTAGYATADGTAIAGQDYGETSGSVTFAASETSRTVDVTVFGDTQAESGETFTLAVTPSPDYWLQDGSASGTIANDDLALSVADVTVAEGHGGPQNAVFTVTLSEPTTQTVTVDFATSDGTATAGSDYTAVLTTLTFPPGITSRQVSVPVLGDTVDEADESFVVTLDNAANARLSRATAEGLITNDDFALRIRDASAVEGHTGTEEAAVMVVLNPERSVPVTVQFTTAPGTATAGADYTTTIGTLTFAPSVTEQIILVPILGDTTVEGPETLSVTLSNAVGATIVEPSAFVGILDDDVRLTVTTSGLGTGTVTSTPPGIDCGADCVEDLPAGAAVTLTATAGGDSVFAGWSGPCAATPGETCDLVLDADATVGAVFQVPGADFYTVTPCRVVDTRDPALGGPAPLAAGTDSGFAIAGRCGVPPSAKAVAVNITATAATVDGHLRLYPSGSPRPLTSAVNFRAGLTRANNAIVGLGSGAVTVYAGLPSGLVHVVIDVTGYFE